MNYRHHFHAGNFADVVKHVLLLALVEGMQRKDKGFLYLDTHAGRGSYDLAQAARGDSLARRPEWPEGWGRLGGARDLPAPVANYVSAVTRFGQDAPTGGLAGGTAGTATGAADHAPRLYPGSPTLVGPRLRPQDRAVWCELHPEEHRALLDAALPFRRVRVEARDGYEAVRGCLPPLERRALVLIDPPYEQADESQHILAALRDGLRRLPAGTFAVWYPITERADAPTFLAAARPGEFPPTWTAEVTVAGAAAGLKMRGAGVMVVNPPWQLEQNLAPALHWLAATLAQAPGGAGGLRWLVPEA